MPFLIAFLFGYFTFTRGKKQTHFRMCHCFGSMNTAWYGNLLFQGIDHSVFKTLLCNRERLNECHDLICYPWMSALA